MWNKTLGKPPDQKMSQKGEKVHNFLDPPLPQDVAKLSSSSSPVELSTALILIISTPPPPPPG